jgi:hypothetical protein
MSHGSPNGTFLNLVNIVRGDPWLSLIKGSWVRVPVVLENLSPHIRQSSTGLLKGRVVCGLPVIHAPKRPLVVIQKEKRNLPGIAGPQ